MESRIVHNDDILLAHVQLALKSFEKLNKLDLIECMKFRIKIDRALNVDSCTNREIVATSTRCINMTWSSNDTVLK
jgi:hypothetical protein